jgi:hypothetical protein
MILITSHDIDTFPGEGFEEGRELAFFRGGAKLKERFRKIGRTIPKPPGAAIIQNFGLFKRKRNPLPVQDDATLPNDQAAPLPAEPPVSATPDPAPAPDNAEGSDNADEQPGDSDTYDPPTDGKNQVAEQSGSPIFGFVMLGIVLVLAGYAIVRVSQSETSPVHHHHHHQH